MEPILFLLFYVAEHQLIEFEGAFYSFFEEVLSRPLKVETK